MSTYTFALPDGTSIEVPRGTSTAAADAWAKKNFPEAYKDTQKPAAKGGFWGDVAGSVTSGIGGLVQFPGQVGTLLGADRNNAFNQVGEGIDKFGQSLKSDKLKEQEMKIHLALQEAEKAGLSAEVTETLKQYASNPYVTFNELLKQLPQLLVSFGAGAAAQMGTKALVKGATEGALRKAGVAGASTAAASMQGADVGQETYDRVYAAAALKFGFNEEAAKAKAIEEARKAALKASVVSGATMAVLPGAEKALLGGVGAKGALKIGLKTAAGETAQETAEEGSGAYFANVGEQAVDPSVNTLQGVGHRATLGGMLGGLMGGAAGMREGRQGTLAERAKGRAAADEARALAASQEEEKIKTEEAFKKTPDYLLKLDKEYKERTDKIAQMQEAIKAFGNPDKDSAEALLKKQARADLAAYIKSTEGLLKDFAAKKGEIERSKLDPLHYFLGEDQNDAATKVNPAVDPNIARFVGETQEEEPAQAYVIRQAELARQNAYLPDEMPKTNDKGQITDYTNAHVEHILADPQQAALAVANKARVPGVTKKQSDTIMDLVALNLKAQEEAQDAAIQSQAEYDRPDMVATQPTQATNALPTEAWAEGIAQDNAQAEGERRTLTGPTGVTEVVASGNYKPGEVIEDAASAHQHQAYGLLRDKYTAAMAERAQAAPGSQEALDLNKRLRALRRALDSLDVSTGASTVAPVKDFSGLDELMDRALEKPAGGVPATASALENSVARLKYIKRKLLNAYITAVDKKTTLKDTLERIPDRETVRIKQFGDQQIDRTEEKAKRIAPSIAEVQATKKELIAAAIEEIKLNRELMGLVPLTIPDAQLAAQISHRVDERFLNKSPKKKKAEDTTKNNAFELQELRNKRAKLLELQDSIVRSSKYPENARRKINVAAHVAAITKRINELENEKPETTEEASSNDEELKKINDRLAFVQARINKLEKDAVSESDYAELRQLDEEEVRLDAAKRNIRKPFSREDTQRQAAIQKQLDFITNRLQQLGGTAEKEERRGSGASTPYGVSAEKAGEYKRLISARNNLVAQQGIGWAGAEIGQQLQKVVDHYTVGKNREDTRANQMRKAMTEGTGRFQRGEQAPILRERQYPGQEVQTGSTEFGKAYAMEKRVDKFNPTADDKALVKRMREEEIQRLNDAAQDPRYDAKQQNRIDDAILALQEKLSDPVTQDEVARAKEMFGTVDEKTGDIFKEGFKKGVTDAGNAVTEARQREQSNKSAFGGAMAAMKNKSPLQDKATKLAQAFGKAPAGAVANAYAKAKATLDAIRSKLKPLKAETGNREVELVEAAWAKINNDMAEADAKLRDTQRTVSAALKRIREKRDVKASAEEKYKISEDEQILLALSRELRDELRPQLVALNTIVDARSSLKGLQEFYLEESGVIPTPDALVKNRPTQRESLLPLRNELAELIKFGKRQRIEGTAEGIAEFQRWVDKLSAEINTHTRKGIEAGIAGKRLTRTIRKESVEVGRLRQKQEPVRKKIAAVTQAIDDIKRQVKEKYSANKPMMETVMDARKAFDALELARTRAAELRTSLLDNGMPQEEVAKDQRVKDVVQEIETADKAYKAAIGDVETHKDRNAGVDRYLAEAEKRYEASWERAVEQQQWLEAVYGDKIEKENEGKFEVTAPFGVAKEKPVPQKVKGSYGTAYNQATVTQTDPARLARAEKRLKALAVSGLPAISFDGKKEMRVVVPEETPTAERLKVAEWLRSKGHVEAAQQVEDDALEVVIDDWLVKRKKGNPQTNRETRVTTREKQGPTEVGVKQAVKAARAQFDAAIRMGQRETQVRPQKSKANATFRTGVRRGRPTKEAEENTRLGIGPMSEGDPDTLFRKGANKESLAPEEAKQVVDDFLKTAPADLKDKIKFYPSEKDIPLGVMDALWREGGIDDETGQIAKGGLRSNGDIFLVGDAHTTIADLLETLAHEVTGHYGVRKLLGKEGITNLTQRLANQGLIESTAKALGVEEGLKEARLTSRQLGESMQKANERAVQEILAHLEEKRPSETTLQKIGRFVQELIGAINAALTRMGLRSPYKATPADLYHILRQARNSLQEEGNAAGDTVFTYGGRKASLSSLETNLLGRAKSMLSKGTPKEEVWKKTGWFMGAEGDLRFEIDDSKAEFSEAFNKAILEEDYRDFKGNLGDVLKDGELFARYPELKNIKVVFEENSRRLGSYNHAEKTLTLTIPEDEYSSASASEYVGNLMDTILHEVQHAVQDIEEFSPGTNTTATYLKLRDPVALEKVLAHYKRKGDKKNAHLIDYALQEIRAIEKEMADAEDEHRQKIAEAEKAYETAVEAIPMYPDFPAYPIFPKRIERPSFPSRGATIEDYEAYNRAMKKAGVAQDAVDAEHEKASAEHEKAIAKYEKDVAAYDAHRLLIEKLHQAHMRAIEKSPAATKHDKIQDVWETVEKSSPYIKLHAAEVLYNAKYGEVEARDTPARKNLSMAERRRTTPYSSQDITMEELYFRKATRTHTNPALGEAAETFIGGRNRDKLAEIREHATGLALQVRLSDSFAALEKAVERGDQTAAIQTSYSLMTYNQRNHVVQQSVMHGAPIQKKSKHAGKDVHMVEAQDGASLAGVSKLLDTVKGFGDAQATSDAFTMYALAKRAADPEYGWARVFADTPTPHNATAEQAAKIATTNAKKAKARAEADKLASDPDTPFKVAYKEYQDYNKGMLQFAEQAGVVSQDEFRRLASKQNYTPLFREDKHGNVVLEIDRGRDITVGRLADEPHLQKLLGGDGQVMDFFTASVRNASLLVEASLHNIASRDAVFALQAMGAAHPVSDSEKGDNIVEFRMDGVLQRFAVDTAGTKAGDIPADLIVKGFAGVPASLSSIVRLAGIPAQILRKTVTRNPLFMAKSLVRDSTSAWLVTGANMNPITGTLKELGQSMSGTADKTLDRRGITGGALFAENETDLQRIQDEARNEGRWWNIGYYMAKLDHAAHAADAITRRNVYNGALKDGASDIQASLTAYRSMPFSKRGTSTSLRSLNHMVPFLSTMIQGWDVMYRAVKGDMPLKDLVDVRMKLAQRGAMIFGLSMMYAMAMADDDEYQKANTSSRLNNWFVRLPGMDKAIKVPVPFELGIVFKMFPEALVRMMYSDKDKGDEMRAVGNAFLNMLPNIAIPQAALPIAEAMLNKSFFTGNAIEGRALEGMDIGERFDDKTSEMSKALGFNIDVMGKQYGVSPKMLEYMMSQYTAGLYPMLGALVDTMMPAPTPSKPERKLADIFRSVVLQEDEGGEINRLYDKIEKFTKASTTLKHLQETNPVKARSYFEENKDAVGKGMMASKMKAAIDKISNAENKVRASALSSEQKRVALDNFKRVKSNLATQFSAQL